MYITYVSGAPWGIATQAKLSGEAMRRESEPAVISANFSFSTLETAEK